MLDYPFYVGLSPWYVSSSGCGLQMLSLAVNILNKQSWIADKGVFLGLGG